MKQLFLGIIYMICALSSIGQDYTILHNKYWYYRTRLRNDFMKVGLEHGCSIPMGQRGLGYEALSGGYNFPNPEDGADAQWGDAMGELGYYIGVLATEYYLLKLNNQKTDSVKYELYCALQALNRVDYYAEPYFTHAIANSTQPQTFGAALNGFMLRDDVPKDFIQNNMKNFNYFGNRGFCSKIKLNNIYKSSGNGAITQGETYVQPNGPGTNGYWEKNYAGSYISQDNWINCMVGLALVRKFLPPQETYNNMPFMDGQSASINQEAFAIALRVHNYMKADPLWLLRYPSGNLVGSRWGGVGTSLAYAYGEALNKLDHFKWGHYSFPDWISFNNPCEFINWANSGGNAEQFFKWNFLIPAQMISYPLLPHISGNLHNLFSMTPGFIANPSAIPPIVPGGELAYKYSSLFITTHNPDVSVLTGNLSALCNCGYSYMGNTTKNYLQAHIDRHKIWHQELLRVVLHGEGNCGNVLNLNQNDYNAANSLIANAPCEGPYNWIVYHSGDGTFESHGNDSPSHWHTQTQLDHPEGRDGNGMIAEFNGIDFMLYHNLINIIDIEKNGISDARKMVDFGRRFIHTNYPTYISGVTWGSQTNPASVKAYEYIVADGNITQNSNVSFLAGKEITLKDGFFADNSANFTAAIEHFECDQIMSNPINLSANARNGQNNQTIYPDLMATSYDHAIDNENETTTQNIDNNHKPTLTNIERQIIESSRQLTGNLNAEISPNPNTGLSKLIITKPDLVASIDVLDPLAKLLMSFNTISFSNDIDLSSYGKGVYSFVIKGYNGDVVVKKVVIQ